MSQNRKKKSSNRGNPRRSSNNRPLGGGGPPPGSGSEGNRRSDSQDRTRQISTIIAVIMLVAIILPVLVGACFYRDTGAAPYDWAHPAEQVPSANSNYDNARFLRRDTAETAPTASLPARQSIRQAVGAVLGRHCCLCWLRRDIDSIYPVGYPQGG